MRVRTAVVPAGGTLTGAYRDAAGVEHRALAPVGDVPMLQHVVDALREAGIERIIAVADRSVQERISGVDLWRQATASGPSNILLSLRTAAESAAGATGIEDQVLFCPCDLPLARGRHFADLIARGDAAADLVAGIVSRRALDAAFPDAPPSSYVHLSDLGPVANCSTCLIRPSAVLAREDLIGRGFEARKSQLRMARLLGAQVIWRFLTRQLTSDHLTARLHHALGIRLAIVPDAAPELAFDVDSVSDYSYAQSRYELRNGAGDD